MAAVLRQLSVSSRTEPANKQVLEKGTEFLSGTERDANCGLSGTGAPGVTL